MRTTSQAYLLDSSYAQYARNYLSSSYPLKLVAMEALNTIDDFIIEISEKAEVEYLTFMHQPIKSNLQALNPREYNSTHLSGLEIANQSIINQIDNKFNENN